MRREFVNFLGDMLARRKELKKSRGALVCECAEGGYLRKIIISRGAEATARSKAANGNTESTTQTHTHTQQDTVKHTH